MCCEKPSGEEDEACRVSLGLGGGGTASGGKRGNILERRHPDTRRGEGVRRFGLGKVYEQNRKQNTGRCFYVCGDMI